MELAGIESNQDDRGACLNLHSIWIEALLGNQVFNKRLQPGFQLHALASGFPATTELKNVLHDGVHAQTILIDDLHEPFFRPAELRTLPQQLTRVAYRPQRVTDLVGDAGSQPPQRSELKLLGPLAHRGCILEKDESAMGVVPT